MIILPYQLISNNFLSNFQATHNNLCSLVSEKPTIFEKFQYYEYNPIAYLIFLFIYS
jgi:hypothetical protein